MQTAYGAMSCVYTTTEKRFVAIIDEWDVLIRDEAISYDKKSKAHRCQIENIGEK